MKVDNKNKILAEVQATDFFDKLPSEIHGFTLKKIFAEDDDKFIYFSYENIQVHRAVIAYFHEETLEYKIRVKIGLNEFCITKFFTSNFADYCEKISAELDKLIESFFDGHENLNPFITEKKIAQWAYGKNLPENIAGFELFIKPSNPVEVTNGSFIIINYSDFSTASDFTITYNIYTENFSCEYCINHVSQVNYIFDSDSLAELEKKLQKNLSVEISRISDNFHGRE